uniref:Uncharacterized protein n=1 Tax=Anguilla anguilla TaxID=7936 RepID=A0A0E9VD93_ANGAN
MVQRPSQYKGLSHGRIQYALKKHTYSKNEKHVIAVLFLAIPT